ncbi:outer membrane protein [Granulicella tundricola]|uniref:Outer membrane protein beta-barrel domain-containing protein n=1 Tax=Granulicella tundricola (strain ATCC BAA-1859 / DSM 23138 / MP5ACTX9) TaxID=1198114 RepID=E8X2R0_GRATM|nr:hypothetical protein [Granulicella tundricola]ADW70357.1 hypothetical protein AciX9_3349 [Granulicella tundricola MP5ACTX9]
MICNILRRLATTTFAATAFLASASLLQAQSFATAARTVSISAFAGASRVNTDYGSTNAGYLFGADFTRHYHLVDPSLEVRATIAPGSSIGEKTFSGGLRLQKRFHRFQPYADLLAGAGSITFNHPTVVNGIPYASDNSFIYVFGGGMDYYVTRNFAVKADYNQQLWRLGQNLNRLTPSALTIGIVYRIPFHPYNR